MINIPVSKIFTNQEDAIAVALYAMTSRTSIQYECLPGGQVRITVENECAALLKEKPTPSYAYVQEGGSASELYLHAHETKTVAIAGRVDCASDGAYKTGAVVEISPCLRALGEVFYATAEALIGTVPDAVLYSQD